MTDVFRLIVTESFLQRALVVGVLISLCSALLGVSLVLKRFSMIGDGLSHVGFGAMAIAAAANVAPLPFALPIVVVCAFLLLRMNEKGRIKGDAAIALISTGALAMGVMVTSMTTGMNVDIYNYMFGSILTMQKTDVAITCVLSAVVISLFVVFYDEIFAVTFDESFAKATGTKVSVYNMLIASLTAITIVIGMRMMGALLISSLIIFPSVISMRVCKSYRKVVFFSCLVSVFCFVSGLVISVKYEAPTGASVVCVNIFLLAFFSVIKAVADIPESLKTKRPKKLLVALCCFAFAFVYILCMFSGEKTVLYDKKQKPLIVATAFAQYDFAKQIAGEKADVIMLLSPGEESHTFEPTPKDIVNITECDLFIYDGGESEKWVDTILESVNEKKQIIKMMDEVTLYEEELVEGMEHNHEDHEHENEEKHSEYDEHVWTSPKNAITISKAIGKALIAADNENKQYYEKSTEAYVEKLNALDRSFRTIVAKAKRNTIIVGDRFPMRYLCEEYGIRYFAAFPGCSAQVEANPVTINYLIKIVENEKINTVFKIDMSTGLVAKTISESTGSEVETLYSCHTLSAEDFENGESYLSLMERNIKAIEKALN